MLDHFGGVNWLAVLIGAIAYFMVGAPWFSPLGFERAWDRAIGFERPAGLKWGPVYYVVPFVGCLVISATTALLLRATGARSMLDGLELGLVVGVGYAAAVAGVMALSPVTPRPATLAAIVGGYHIVGITVAAVIIVAMS